MSASSHLVQAFFQQYERSRNTFDPLLIESQYPDSFMFAGPNGARIAEKAAVLAALASGQELLKKVGHRTTRLVSLNETSLDEHYAMVRARFEWTFEKVPAPIDIDLDSTFILHIKDGQARIVFQHEHEDFQQALRAGGVLPATAAG